MNTIIKDLKELEGKTIQSITHDENNTFTIQTTDGVDYDVVATGQVDLSGAFATLSFERLDERELALTTAERDIVSKEGWDIFSADTGLEIQRIDDDAIFECDEDVWYMLTTSDNPLHKKALAIIEKENPVEYTRIMENHEGMKYHNALENAILAFNSIINGDDFWEGKDRDILKFKTTNELRSDVIKQFTNQKNISTQVEIHEFIQQLMEQEYSVQVVRRDAGWYALGSIDGINEGELFWEEKVLAFHELMDMNIVRDQISEWVKEQNYTQASDAIYQEIYDQISEFMEQQYNRLAANFHEAVEFKVSNVVFGNFNDLYLPDNFQDVVTFIVDHIVETGDINKWDDNDVRLGFKKYVESKSMNQFC